MKRIGLIGLGALGAMFGAQLQKYHGCDFYAIVSSERKTRYQKDGLIVNGERVDFHYVTPEEAAGPLDLLIFGTKSNGLKDAIHICQPLVGDNTVVMSMLNGVSSEQILGAAYGEDKILYAAAMLMDAKRDGNQIHYKNMGFLMFGERDGRVTDRVKAVKAALQDCGRIYDGNMERFVWSKFMLNCGINQVSAVRDCGYESFQHESPERQLMVEAMREVVQLSEAAGVNLSEDDIAYWLEAVKSLNPQSCPSTRQDIMAHRRTEVDLFGETVVRMGKEYGVPTPVNAALTEQILQMQSGFPE